MLTFLKNDKEQKWKAMDNEKKEIIIQNYLAAFNNFDLEGMMADFGEGILFKNVSKHHEELESYGITTFKKQAIFARKIFSSRKQLPLAFYHENERTLVDISYEATIGMDLPNGMKEGQKIQMSGKSIFEFEEGKITVLTDEG
jgi:hypothetical protein